MPKKTVANHTSIREFEDVLSFFTTNKKGHFDSESKLFDSLCSQVSSINPNYSVYLTTYPFIAVHIAFGLANGLSKDKDKLKEAILSVLERHLKLI